MPKPVEKNLPDNFEQLLRSDNWFNYADFYAWVVENHNVEKVVEVGSWKGHSISFLANKLLEKGEPFELFAVDLWEKLPKDNELWDSCGQQIEYLYDVYTTNLQRAGVRGHVFDIIGDSADSAKHFDDASLDFVFIDASHDAVSVEKDIKAWKRKVKKGGIIAGHDVSQDGVRSSVEKIFDSVKQFDGDVWYTTV